MNLKRSYILALIGVVFIITPLLFGFILGITSEVTTSQGTLMPFNVYLINTFILVFFSFIIATFIGIISAMVVTLYDFKGRKIFEFLLLLPLAIPVYIATYAYAHFFSYSGLFYQTTDYIVDFASLKGAIFIYSLFLYPYVYVTCKVFMQNNLTNLVENAQLLGLQRAKILRRVVFPIIKPAAILGGLLVMFEVISDFGVVQYLGIPTFSTAIYTSWVQLNDIGLATRLALILLIFVVILLSLEYYFRRHKSYAMTTTKQKKVKREKLSKSGNVFVYSFLIAIISLSFVIPIIIQFRWLILSWDSIRLDLYLESLINTILLGIIATVIIIFIALIVISYNRFAKGLSKKIFSKLILVGYILPGTITALFILIFIVSIDSFFREVGIQVVLLNSVLILVIAYVIKYIAVGYQVLESGYEKVGNSISEASFLLGKNKLDTFFEVDFKLMRSTIIMASALVMIEIFKELTLTLLLRPANFNTLSTSAFRYANDELLFESAIYSLTIILVVIVVMFIFRKYLLGGEDDVVY